VSQDSDQPVAEAATRARTRATRAQTGETQTRRTRCDKTSLCRLLPIKQGTLIQPLLRLYAKNTTRVFTWDPQRTQEETAQARRTYRRRCHINTTPNELPLQVLKDVETIQRSQKEHTDGKASLRSRCIARKSSHHPSLIPCEALLIMSDPRGSPSCSSPSEAVAICTLFILRRIGSRLPPTCELHITQDPH
jgi:hypothetical protein